MNEVLNWAQSNWYELGSLFAQLSFLAAGVWFARKILNSMRATQQQFGALLKLSMTNGLEEHGLEEHSNGNEAARELLPSSEPTVKPEAEPSVVVNSMLSPAPERRTAYSAFERPARREAPLLSRELSGGTMASSPLAGPAMTATKDPTPYVAAPLTLPAEEDNGGHVAAAGRGVVRWLQTPMARSSGPSPWRRIVRWLQAPARS